MRERCERATEGISWPVSPVDLVFTVTMDAGITEALVDLGEAGGVMVTLWTQAGEAVDAVDTSAAIVARVDGALIDVNVTHGACEEQSTFGLVSCNHLSISVFAS